MGGNRTLLQKLEGHLYDHPHRRRSVSPGLHLAVGSLVEVQTDEEDFTDVYFSATVIPSPPPTSSTSKKQVSSSSRKQIYVEYHDLLAREGGTELLREYVDVSFVRPVPPQEIVAGLGHNDVVDAVYNDGWWTGVVKQVVEGGERFVVNFRTPPDELEFGLSDLRVHWDWVDGTWVRPNKQAEAASVSEMGEKVEVSRDKDKTHYSWFRSTICKTLDDGAFLVEFCTLKDSEGGHVRGIVDPVDVRPCPPHLKEKPFVLREKVDAYFDFGWWSGVISKVLEGGKYVVFLTHTKTSKVFRQSELRPNMEWKGGKWFTSSKFSKAKHNTPESSSGNTITNSNSSGDRMNTCDGNTPKLRKHQNPSKGTLTLCKRRKDLSDSRDAPSRTLKRHKEGNVIGASEQDKRHDSSITKMSLDSPSPVATPLTAEDDQSSGIHSQEKTITKERELITTQNGAKVVSPSSLLKTITQISHGKEPSTEAVEDVQRMHLKQLSVPCAENGSSVSGSSRGAKGHRSNSKEKKLVSDQKKQPDNVAVQKLKDSTRSETEASSNKRKRGRPPKKVQARLKASNNGDNVEENAQNGIVATDGLSAHESDQHIIAEEGEEASLQNKENMPAADNHQPDSLTNGSAAETTSPKSNGEKLVKESMGLQPDGSSERGSKPVDGHTFESQVEDASRSKTVEVIVMDADEDIMQEPLCNVVLGDEPLSNSIEAMQSPSIVNFSRVSPAPNVGESIQEAEMKAPVLKETKTGEQTPNSTDKISVDTPDEQQTLPFVKNTFLWETIESMEVFKQTPQKPHFQPLEQQRKSLREGMAIGYMVNFSSVVEKVSKLQFGDPESITDDILDTLAELEVHGFDVGVVRDRVVGFVALRDKQGKLVDEANELESQILVHSNEECRIEKEISEMNEELRRLQEKVSVAQSALEKENGKRVALQAKLLETKQGIENVEREFQGIASSKY